MNASKHKILLLVLLVMSVSILLSCESAGTLRTTAETGENPLRIPELIDSRATPQIELVMQVGSHEFYAGVESETKGFNGNYLGPTVRLYRDTDATITFTNNIGEPTTVHGHGLHVIGEIDGAPQSIIEPGASWGITIPVRQEAGTSWYHPHQMGKTAHHVHAGLAGMYIIEDENSLSLDLPKDYGVNDIPLIVQDRSFSAGEMVQYAVTEQQIRDGLREDTLVINGTIDAYHAVPQGWVRLRLLNGSNARFYRFSFSDGRPFYKIATEGGFLNQPVERESIDMSPGERNEIMVDLSDGDSVALVAGLLPADPEDSRRAATRPPEALVVELRVTPSLPASGSLPLRLNDIVFLDRADAVQTRTISLEMERPRDNDGPGTLAGMNIFAINGRTMNMSHVNFRVNKGDAEIWRVTGQRMPHPFHVHGASFQILTVDGGPPSEADRGWKDTVVVGDAVTEIIVRFDYEAADEFPFMIHCHMLEHEEYGMMAQFTVE